MLPQAPTSFVGRETELAEADRLLANSRLLTLTGPGGAGKTRLAIELARRAAINFPDGAYFVPLAAVRDHTLVPVEIAGALGLQDSRSTALLDHLAANLAGRDALLVVDNMEQVIEAATFVADLLAATDSLRIVATSRAPLHISWEQEMPVPPLSEAVQLFTDRAAAASPGFSRSESNGAAIAAIADRLDRLPLAIELAASRVKVLPPQAILERLDDSLALLVSETRDVPDRQRTLRATIAWSHELLSDPAQQLLAICSAFRGGIDLTTLDDVCAAVGFDAPVLDALTELVDHSLLRRIESPAPRFGMLETVREFAAEKLGEEAARAVRDAHADAMWRMAAALQRPPSAPSASDLDLLELEHDNLRAALDHCAHADPLLALRIANRLAGFWGIRGHFSEGRRRLATLRRHVGEDTPEFADAMAAEAWLATDQGDRESALPLIDAAIGWARDAGDVIREAEALLSRGRAKLVIGDPTGGRADIEASLALQEEFGHAGGLAAALWLGGAAAQADGELELACERLERSAALAGAARQPVTTTRARYLLGSVRLDLGDVEGAEAALADSVPAVVDLDDRFAIPIALSLLARLATARGRPRAALRLAGAAAEYEETNQTNRPQFVRALLDAALAPVIAQVGQAAARRLQVEGRALPIGDLIADGIEPRPEEAWQVGGSPPLTAREEEIAALVAAGLTNREVAERLVVSVRTVETHVARALTKLGFTNRGQLTAWAHHEGLMTNVRGRSQ